MKMYVVKWTCGAECKRYSGAHTYCTRNRSEFKSRDNAEKAMVALLARPDVCSATIEVAEKGA